MNTSLRNIVLVVIVVAGFVLRSVNLSSNPPGFFADEAVIGLDAYTIFHTGKDHTGKPLRFFVEALGDWRGFVPIVSAIPPVALFGLTETATRIPSAIYGSISIVLIYAVTAILFGHTVGILAAILLAISPWHTHISRMGFEFMSFPTWFMMGLLLFLLGLKKPLLLLPAALVLGIAIYTYAPARLFVPLLVIFLFIFYRTILLQQTHVTMSIVGAIFFVLLTIPLVVAIVRGTATARLQVISVQTNQQTTQKKLAHIARTYGNYFSPQFLFIKGDIDFPGQFITRHSIRGIGLLYLIQLPFALVGFAGILKHLRKSHNLLIVAWLLLYPLGGALTVNENPFATRGIIGVIPFQILTGLGIVSTLRWIQKRWRRMTMSFLLILSVGFLLSFMLFIQKWQQYPAYAADFWGWQFGPRDVMAYFLVHKDSYDQLYLVGNFNSPDILLRFYDPDNTCRNKCMIGDSKRLDYRKKQLFAIETDKLTDFPIQQFKLLDTIYYPNGQAAFYIGSFVPEYLSAL